MANANELLSLDVAAVSQKLGAREVSPVEVTDAYLARIEEVDEKLHAYITVTADVAREAAKRAESESAAGNWRGPFNGLPIALKDLCYTKGIVTTGGERIMEEFVPDYDCTLWSRLAAQGAVLLGKLTLHEFAYGITSSNPHWGVVKNPYDTTRIPGGSSGGSAAAIVARMAAATIGTDAAASIRIPAAFCGCVGLKPTWSRVSRYGVIPLSDSLDHAGPITRTVRDAALTLVRAQRARTVLLADAMRALDDHDVLIAPVCAIAAPRIGTHPGHLLDDNGEAIDNFLMILRFTMPFDATGQPALALPTGLSPAGLPLSMQIIGPPLGEPSVIRAADAS